MTQSHPQTNAAKQREAVDVAVRAAIDAMRDDIRAFGFYPHNHRRISQAEILRRAGGVDKKTLRAPYHAHLKELISGFVQSHKAVKLAEPHDSTEQRSGVVGVMDGGYNLAQLAQALVAAQYLRDEAIEKLNRQTKADAPKPK